MAQSRSRSGGKDLAKGSWKFGFDKSKGGEADKGKSDNQRLESEDKLSALKEFRKKNGLCFKCRNKWAPGHKCPQQVPLHVIEEILLDALEVDDDSELFESTEVIEETVLAAGQAVGTNSVKRKTLKLCGWIGKADVLILVDSGSVGTFISSQLADRLQLPLIECTPTQYVAADFF